jgi:hypothetical protein
MTTEEMYDYLKEMVGASDQTMSVACCLCGYSKETMEGILYALTGYRDFEQYQEELEGEEE